MYNYLLLKRLHSLVGIIPVGAFLCFHLYTNATAFKGQEVYDRHVREIHDMPILFLVELCVIWIPILFHAILGVYIIYKGRYNSLRYPYVENIYFTVQRLTGMIAFVFIIYHVLTTRFKFDLPDTSCFIAMQNELFNVKSIAEGATGFVPSWKFYFYILGILSACFHFCNGLWSFCINFGILQGQKIQKLSRIGFFVVGIILSVLGFISLAGFYRGQ